MKTFQWNNCQVSYLDQGKGYPVLLLHGYLETKEVWGDFAQSLADNYRVIAPDIPGHGKSSVLAPIHTMEMMASVVNALLEHLFINTCTVVGHSMGGYVALALAEKFPVRVDNLVLFHSSLYADTEEKKASRVIELEKIGQGNLDEVVKNHIPKTFATKNINNFQTHIHQLITVAQKHNPEGVSALIRGMMERPDRQQLIVRFSKPILYLMGCFDNFISKEVAEKMVALNPASQLQWLESSGHMGFIEQSKESTHLLKTFIKKCSFTEHNNT